MSGDWLIAHQHSRVLQLPTIIESVTCTQTLKVGDCLPEAGDCWVSNPTCSPKTLAKAVCLGEGKLSTMQIFKLLLPRQ
jgi:hypothetical protein